MLVNNNCISNSDLNVWNINNAITKNPEPEDNFQVIVNGLKIPYNSPLNETQFPATIITDATQVVIDDVNNVYISAVLKIVNDVSSSSHSSYILQSNNTACSWSPLSDNTNPYIMGIDVNDNGQLTAVGYAFERNTTAKSAIFYQGSVSGEGTWNDMDLSPLNPSYTIESSWSSGVMNGLAVGSIKYENLDGVNAFLYDLNNTQAYSINYPGAVSTNARDIWHDGGVSYVVVGGYLNNPIEIVQTRNFSTIDTVLNSGYGFMMRWNATSNTASNWKTFSQDNIPTPGILSAFTRVATDDSGGYNLLAENFNQLTVDASNIPEFINAIVYDQSLSQYTGHSDASNVNVPTTSTNGFGTATWYDYTVQPGNSDGSIGVTAAGVIGNIALGTSNDIGYIFQF